MAFLEFLKRLYDMESEYLGSDGAASGPDGGMGDVLGQLQMGLLHRRHGAAMQQHIAPPMVGGPTPEFGGGSGPVDLRPRPDAGDLADVNSEVGGNPLAGLFGSRPRGR